MSTWQPAPPGEHHPWRTGKYRPSRTPAETTRTCKECGVERPITSFRLIGRWHERVCKPCRYARDTRQRQGKERKRYDRSQDVARNRQRRQAERLAKRDLVANPLPPRNWWSVQHAALYYGKSISTIHVYIKAGILEARRAEDGYSYRVRPRGVLDY